jgi:uncharacterized membrane protein YeaQ/YmgE (transglycosylase-associated protein family)
MVTVVTATRPATITSRIPIEREGAFCRGDRRLGTAARLKDSLCRTEKASDELLPGRGFWPFGGKTMSLIIALIMGGIMGWLASIVMFRNGSMGIIWNVVVGCVGSILGRFLLGGYIGGGHLRGDAFDWRTLLTSFLGAVILLAIVNLVQRGRLR